MNVVTIMEGVPIPVSIWQALIVVNVLLDTLFCQTSVNVLEVTFKCSE